MSDIVQRLKDSKPDNSVCEHGRQRRKCPICERDVEIEQQAATIAELQHWKDVVIDELVIEGIYTAIHEQDPRKALHEAIDWHVQVALDPAVSKEAAALRDTHLAAIAELRETQRKFGTMMHEQMDKNDRQQDTIRALVEALDSLQALLYPVAAQVPVADECLGIINRLHSAEAKARAASPEREEREHE